MEKSNDYARLTKAKMQIKPEDKNCTNKDKLILYVDDEESLRRVFTRGINRMGYQTKVFGLGNLAIEEFRKEPHTYNAVLTDLVMPGMDGLTLASEIRKIRIDIPIILLTADTLRVSDEFLLREAQINFAYNKPITFSILKNALDTAVKSSLPLPILDLCDLYKPIYDSYFR